MQKLRDIKKLWFKVELRRTCSNLIGSSVWADVELAGSGAGIMHSAQHLLPAHQHLDLLPGWHTLPTLGLLESLADEWRIVIHLRLRALALDPARKSGSETGGYVWWVCVCVRACASTFSSFIFASKLKIFSVSKKELVNAPHVTQSLKSVMFWLGTLRHPFDLTNFFIFSELATLESQWGEEWQMFSL